MNEIFDDVIELPDPDSSRQFDELVGIDNAKVRLVKESEKDLRDRRSAHLVVTEK